MIISDVFVHYAESGRYYHNINHIVSMLEYKDEIISGSDFGCEIDLEVINFSILYHDVIMVFGSDSNEENSAFYAVNDLKGSGLNIDQINHIAEIIRGTSSHSHPCSVEASIVFDADLAILGSEPQEYDNYANLVRLEYGDYSDKDFYSGRLNFLKSLYESSDNIYSTDFGVNAWEEKARLNIKREIDFVSSQCS